MKNLNQKLKSYCDPDNRICFNGFLNYCAEKIRQIKLSERNDIKKVKDADVNALTKDVNDSKSLKGKFKIQNSNLKFKM